MIYCRLVMSLILCFMFQVGIIWFCCVWCGVGDFLHSHQFGIFCRSFCPDCFLFIASGCNFMVFLMILILCLLLSLPNSHYYWLLSLVTLYHWWLLMWSIFCIGCFCFLLFCFGLFINGSIFVFGASYWYWTLWFFYFFSCVHCWAW